MPRGPSKLRHRDLTRALRACQEGGLQVTSVEIDPESGKIIINSGPGASLVDAREANAARALNNWLAEEQKSR